MFKFRASALIAFSGVIWFGAGLYLLQLGLHFLVESANLANNDLYVGPLLSLLAPLGSFDQAILLLVVAGLTIGFLKGKFVLSKTVRKTVERIISFTPPVPFTKMYSAKYCILLGCMILIGMMFKILGFSFDIRGLVDVAIGSALINGSMLYLKQAVAVKNAEKAYL